MKPVMTGQAAGVAPISSPSAALERSHMISGPPSTVSSTKSTLRASTKTKSCPPSLKSAVSMRADQISPWPDTSSTIFSPLYRINDTARRMSCRFRMSSSSAAPYAWATTGSKSSPAQATCLARTTSSVFS